ncbi:MAG: IS1634 family transposase [bacterium]|nr:IS1634 family transposase [bacterium]
MEALSLYDLFNKYVPNDKDDSVNPAEGLCIMVSNIICCPKPLYKIEEWLVPYTDGILEKPINASLFNDDRLGKNLDALFQADRNSLMTELSSNAIKVHNLIVDKIHNDTTSITFLGAYEKQDPMAVQLKRGFNKDHRPDCKQIVFGLNTTEDGHVPISYQLYNGNQTDDKTHIANWNKLRTLLQKEDFTYIADCKLCTFENLKYIDKNSGLFITLMPKTRSEVKAFYQKAKEQKIPWQYAYEIENSRKKGQKITYSTYEGEKTQENFRLIWVHSTAKEEQDRNRRENKIQKAIKELKRLSNKLNQYSLKTKDQIESELKKINKGLDRFIKTSVIDEKEIVRVQAYRGRPGPKTVYREKEIIHYKLVYFLDEKALEEEANCDGIFPIITNTVLDSTEVLRTYKTQPFLEKRIYTKKSVLEVAPVFLKLPRRIEAMMFLYFVALMIISLIERNIRKNMKHEKLEKLPILPQNMKTATPTWNNICYFYRNVHMTLVYSNNELVQIDVKGISELHRRVNRLLEVPESVYKNLNETWCTFETTFSASSKEVELLIPKNQSKSSEM